MNIQQLILAVVLLFAITSNCVSAPCEFKGIIVGEKYSWIQIMNKLNIKRFKLNPNVSQVMVIDADKSQYGDVGANERSLWRIGPYCLGTECYIPFGVEMQPLTPAYVRITYGEENIVTDIMVHFNARNWNSVVASLSQEFGPNWKMVEDRKFEIKDPLTKASEAVDRITYEWKFTVDQSKVLHSCEINVTNFDTIFKHYDPLGPYQATLTISRIN